MTTVNVINRQSREIVDEWEVPAEIEHIDFGSDPLTEAQRDRLVEMTTVTNLEDLQQNWNLRRLTASDVIGAFLRRRNQGREASIAQVQLVEDMQEAVALCTTMHPRLTDKFLDLEPDTMDFNEIQATINRMRRFISRAKDSGHIVPWSDNRPSNTNQSTSDSNEVDTEALAETTF